ncbi:DNA-binding transcriptional LysR family regulator [Azoarcus indigens]|uniref:DNA-binding transcriptional LysR family regulator n=2 Tax=Azoarcus indigens TaxID=29545 RepID=A0A4R6DUV2_9RHOO|nr:DNA-binding transcriptional LysR family regulator [Azoarcus indigens]
MVATPMARVFAAEVGLSFDRLALAADACGRPNVRRILRVSAPTSLAMRWLIPRLHRYHADHPDVEVAVTTVSCVVEDLRGGVDVAIRRGVARNDLWPQHHVVPLLEDTDTLIMSPALFSRRPIREPADVEGHVWLASETRAGDWANWLEAAGLQHLAGRPRQTFDHFFVTRQAVEDGLGIGIGPMPMLEIDIARGNLVMPLPDIRVARTGYIAIFPRQADPAGLFPGFVDWLAAEALRPSGADSPEA